jgi:hypothetical protein
MLSILRKIKEQLVALEEKAADYADSENEKTADKYADVPDELQAAIDALENAIAALEE